MAHWEVRKMKDEGKTKERLVNELAELRQRIAELEASETVRVRAEERVRHLNAVLRAIRNVNQLITREKDRGRLIQGACDNLIETRGYYNAWIALLDEAGGFVTSAEAGLGDEFLLMVEQLKRGELIVCGRRALKQSEVLVTKDPLSTCAGCPLADRYGGRGAMTVRLEHEGKVYGLLSVSVPRDLATDEEELALLQEGAGDIAFALYSIELEEERKRAEEALQESEERLRAFAEALPDLAFVLDENGRHAEVLTAQEHLLYAEAAQMKGCLLHEVLPEEAADSILAVVRRTIETGKLQTLEYELDVPIGRVWFEGRAAPMRGTSGETRMVVWVSRDITERKRAEEALRQSEERYRRITEAVTDYIFTVRVKDGRPVGTTHSPASVAVTGYSPEEFVADRDLWIRMVTEEDRAAVLEQASRVLSGRHAEPLEHRIMRKDGATRWVRNTPVPHYDAQGELVSYDGLIRDVTERLQAQEALKRRATQLATLGEVGRQVASLLEPDPLLDHVVNLTREAFNYRYVSILLVDPASGELALKAGAGYEVKAVKVFRLRQGEEGICGWVAASGEPLLVGDVSQEPRYYPVEALADTRSELAVPIQVKGQVIGVLDVQGAELEAFDKDDLFTLQTLADQVGVAIENARLYEQARQEIAERARVEEALRQRNRELALLNRAGRALTSTLDLSRVLDAVLEEVRRLLDVVACSVWLIDSETDELVCQQVTGPKSDVVRGWRLAVREGVAGWVARHGESLIVPDTQADERHFKDVDQQTGLELRSILSVPLQVKEDVIGVLEVVDTGVDRFRPTDLALVEPLAATAAIAIGNARLYETVQQELTERNRLAAQIHEQAQQLQQIMNTVPEGVLLLDVDGRVILANPVAEKDMAVLAKKVGDTLTHLGDRPLAELLTSPPKGLWHEVATESQSFEVIARPMESGPTPGGWVLVIRDVTQEREIQKRIQQQDRLASVGQLAAGIAHDFNNIMAVIVLYAQMGLRLPDLPPKLRERLTTISRQAEHATDLIQQILDFSRRAVLERRPMGLVPFLKEQVRLLERTLPESIKVDLAYSADEHTVNADPTRMQQVIMNLAVNARDAMPAGGELRIRLDRLQIRPGEAPPLHGMEAGEWVRVTVSDTGAGIPPEVLPHIFDPFFTTKAPLGTGLGLAQVYGIVKQHEGEVDVTTKVGHGTTFTIYLPALSVSEPEARPSETQALPQGQGETILVVEDNAAAREALMDTLELLNYRVLGAANGREALEILESPPLSPPLGGRKGGIALVLSDLVMPEMGGQALFHALRQRGLALPMVMLTGHPMEKELKNLRAQGLSGWLLKPLSVEQLAQVVARALENDG